MNDTQLLKYVATNANCSGVDTELFFEPDNSRNAIRQNLPMIQKICGACRVQEECLTYALRNDVTGIWGGTNHADRKRLRKKLGLKAEPVSFQQYVPKLKTHHHEDLLWRYIDNRDACKYGHPIDNPRDVLVTYVSDTDVPQFKCKACASDSNRRYRESVSALRTEAFRG